MTSPFSQPATSMISWTTRRPEASWRMQITRSSVLATASLAAADLLRQMRQACEVTLVDLPTLAGTGMALARAVAGVVLVVRPGVTPRHLLCNAATELDQPLVLVNQSLALTGRSRLSVVEA